MVDMTNLEEVKKIIRLVSDRKKDYEWARNVGGDYYEEAIVIFIS